MCEWLEPSCVNWLEAYLSAFLLLDPISNWRKSCIFSTLFKPVSNIYNSDEPDASFNIEWVLLASSEVLYIMMHHSGFLGFIHVFIRLYYDFSGFLNSVQSCSTPRFALSVFMLVWPPWHFFTPFFAHAHPSKALACRIDGGAKDQGAKDEVKRLEGLPVHQEVRSRGPQRVLVF